MEKIIVDKDLCIGCGMCVGSNPDYFAFNDEGYAEALDIEVKNEDKNEILSDNGPNLEFKIPAKSNPALWDSDNWINVGNKKKAEIIREITVETPKLKIACFMLSFL